jgi:hypothetical protein
MGVANATMLPVMGVMPVVIVGLRKLFGYLLLVQFDSIIIAFYRRENLFAEQFDSIRSCLFRQWRCLPLKNKIY